MDFTNEEKERINQLYGNDFKDIKPEDAMLIGRWEAWKALNDKGYQDEMKSVKDVSDEKLRSAKEQSAYAMETLRMLRDKAFKRYKAVKDE